MTDAQVEALYRMVCLGNFHSAPKIRSEVYDLLNRAYTGVKRSQRVLVNHETAKVERNAPDERRDIATPSTDTGSARDDRVARHTQPAE